MHHYIRFALPVMSVVALAIAGCQTPAPSAPSTAAAASQTPAAADGTLRIDLSRLIGRHVLVPTAALTPTAVRVRVRVPESTTVTETVVGVDASDVSLAVTSGKNRLIELESLVTDGGKQRVLKRIAAIAAVPSSGTVAVKPNYATTAAARTLGILFDESRRTDRVATERTRLQTALSTIDTAEELTTIVEDETGYSAALNAYKEYNPVSFPSRALAEDVIRYLLQGESLPSTLSGFESGGLSESSGSVQVRVGGIDPMLDQTTTVTFYTPEMQTDTVYDGSASFSVPPGTWTAVARQGSKTAWGTVTVGDDDYDATLDLLFPGSPAIDSWIFHDSPETGWSFDDDVAATDSLVLDAEHSGNKAIRWSVPEAMGTAQLWVNRTSSTDLTAYRYISFKAGSSSSYAPFYVSLQDADGQELTLEPMSFTTSYNEGPLRSFVIDLSEAEVDRSKVAKLVFRFQAPSRSGTPDFYIDDLGYTLVPPSMEKGLANDF